MQLTCFDDSILYQILNTEVTLVMPDKEDTIFAVELSYNIFF